MDLKVRELEIPTLPLHRLTACSVEVDLDALVASQERTSRKILARWPISRNSDI
jgi:hypothetical protein